MKFPVSHSKRVKIPVRSGNVRSPIKTLKDRDRVPKKPRSDGR